MLRLSKSSYDILKNNIRVRASTDQKKDLNLSIKAFALGLPLSSVSECLYVRGIFFITPYGVLGGFLSSSFQSYVPAGRPIIFTGLNYFLVAHFVNGILNCYYQCKSESIPLGIFRPLRHFNVGVLLWASGLGFSKNRSQK